MIEPIDLIAAKTLKTKTVDSLEGVAIYTGNSLNGVDEYIVITKGEEEYKAFDIRVINVSPQSIHAKKYKDYIFLSKKYVKISKESRGKLEQIKKYGTSYDVKYIDLTSEAVFKKQVSRVSTYNENNVFGSTAIRLTQGIVDKFDYFRDNENERDMAIRIETSVMNIEQFSTYLLMLYGINKRIIHFTTPLKNKYVNILYLNHNKTDNKIQVIHSNFVKVDTFDTSLSEIAIKNLPNYGMTSYAGVHLHSLSGINKNEKLAIKLNTEIEDMLSDNTLNELCSGLLMLQVHFRYMRDENLDMMYHINMNGYMPIEFGFAELVAKQFDIPSINATITKKQDHTEYNKWFKFLMLDLLINK